MSWSVSLIGKPALVAQALDEHSGQLSGQSKIEFEAALPHLKALVLDNFAAPDSGCVEPLVKLDANGSGTTRGAEQVSRSCTVRLEALYNRLLV